MADTFTTRYGLILPDPNGSLKTGDDSIRSLSGKLDPAAGHSLLTPLESGPFPLPLSSPAQPSGKAGRHYLCITDGVVYMDTGTGWVALTERIGQVTHWAGAGDPPGGTHMEANGREISRVDYPLWNTIIGTLHGAGNGTTTVNIPTIAGRTIVGRDPSGAVIPNSVRAVGQRGGEERHTQTEQELVPHEHPDTLPQTGQFGATGGDQFVEIAGSRATETGSAGGGQPFNVMQPYTVLTPIVRVR